MSENYRAVVVTGASSGIGEATALHLDRLGFSVFAGVRRDEDGEALSKRASDRLTPIRLDVTDADSIAAAARFVEDATDGRLHALVNNAGLSINGPLELVPVLQIEQLMEVNVIGLMAVTQAFLPMLRATRGRIVNISSGHGLLAIPDKSAYAASKFAVQAISDALRVELRPFGVRVSCLAVGKVETAVLDKIVQERQTMERDADPQVVELYRPLIEFFDREVKDLPGIAPIQVARVVAATLTAAKPKAHATVGPGARKMKNLARLPVGLRDWLLATTLYSKQSPKREMA
jgi:NAD(P)-dependent dehydrogenase (short-subunit alcohol dehydrogenase family)